MGGFNNNFFVPVFSDNDVKYDEDSSPEVLEFSDVDKAESSADLMEEYESVQKEEENIVIPSAPPLEPEAEATSCEDLQTFPDLSELQTELLKEQMPPTAPELCDLDFYQIQQINRRILGDIQQEDVKLPVITMQLNPLTNEERNQYYFNPKLATVLSFEMLSQRYFADQFEGMRKGPLYRELETYYKLQSEIHNLNMDIVQLREAIPKIRKRIWTVYMTEQTFSKKCCQVLVNESVTIKYLTGEYHDNWAASFQETLKNYANTACETHRGKVILCDLQKLIISTLIQETIDGNSIVPKRDELRMTLTTLFHFVVKKTATKDFKENVKNWLERILVVFNKFSLLEDQLFLISHILRCPTEAGFQVVKAVNICQPGKVVDAETIDDWLAILWLSLRPIRQWQKKSNELSTEKDTHWEIVDSEGEDAEEDGEEIKYPNELIFLEVLDRMPLNVIYQCLLGMKAVGDPIQMSAHHLLRVIIFSSSFVAVITEGLVNYQKDRYRTFLKRLAGIVKWIADLVTALFDLDYPKDETVQARLATEYNIFMLRVADHLCRNRSVLQYLSQLNYTLLDLNTYWKLNYYLLTNFPADLALKFHESFKVKMKDEFSFLSSHCSVSQWSPEELYFILETLSSLAMACGDRDAEFLGHIVKSLFHMGYVLEEVREKCYKSVRDVLVAVAGQHPATIEILLREIQLNLDLISSQSLYMLKVLPFDNWRPTMDTIDVIRDMLENYPLDSVQLNIGKLLISYMNWGQINGDGECGKLVLGHEYHCRAAMVVLGAITKKFPKTESYKRMSLTREDADPEKRYIGWSWKMITKLKLHSMDQNRMAQVQKMENNAIKVIPVMRLDFVPWMQRLIDDESNPLAIYVALLLCDVGNDTNQLLEKGFPMLVKLLDFTPYLIITRCLELMVPLFMNNPDQLIKSLEIGKVLDSVLLEEKNLLGLQLSWKANDVVVDFTEMVVNQILQQHSFAWENVQRISWLWLMLLTKSPTWNTSYNILYVLENILKLAATIPGLLDCCRDHLYPLNLVSALLCGTFLVDHITKMFNYRN